MPKPSDAKPPVPEGDAANAGPEDQASAAEFERASHGEQASFVREFLVFLVQNKKWWLIPICLVLVLVGVLVMLGSTGAAPFLYTLF